MLQVKIGHDKEVIGILGLKDGKLVGKGDLTRLAAIVNHLKHSDMSDEGLLLGLPSMLRSYLWAKIIEK